MVIAATAGGRSLRRRASNARTKVEKKASEGSKVGKRSGKRRLGVGVATPGRRLILSEDAGITESTAN